MDGIFNLEILKNPYNWVIIPIMVIFGLVFIDIIMPNFSNPKTE